jgi:hypothetical protein
MAVRDEVGRALLDDGDVSERLGERRAKLLCVGRFGIDALRRQREPSDQEESQYGCRWCPSGRARKPRTFFSHRYLNSITLGVRTARS